MAREKENVPVIPFLDMADASHFVGGLRALNDANIYFPALTRLRRQFLAEYIKVARKTVLEDKAITPTVYPTAYKLYLSFASVTDIVKLDELVQEQQEEPKAVMVHAQFELLIEEQVVSKLAIGEAHLAEAKSWMALCMDRRPASVLVNALEDILETNAALASLALEQQPAEAATPAGQRVVSLTNPDVLAWVAVMEELAAGFDRGAALVEVIANPDGDGLLAVLCTRERYPDGSRFALRFACRDERLAVDCGFFAAHGRYVVLGCAERNPHVGDNSYFHGQAKRFIAELKKAASPATAPPN
jgi:hypothetical protein